MCINQKDSRLRESFCFTHWGGQPYFGLGFKHAKGVRPFTYPTFFQTLATCFSLSRSAM
jgi:hypothetical protein